MQLINQFWNHLYITHLGFGSMSSNSLSITLMSTTWDLPDNGAEGGNKPIARAWADCRENNVFSSLNPLTPKND